ncbi:MAG: hypothetical protein GEU88_02660 [Solirubrobacterales bacterium]|nr:hypothetical protein [Solirubrobacterales bacterium]
MRRGVGLGIALIALVVGMVAAPGASAAKPKQQELFVCKHGCKYRTIQDAVDRSKRDATINVAPGKYREGVIVKGHKHDGLTIQGTGKNPKKVILEGKNARNENGVAQNGIEGIKVDGLRMLNMWARNYATNGFFIHECADYLMKDLYASFNRSYGMYAFDCTGGRITKSVGWGHGDSAFYIGATPPQKKPDWTSLDHLDGHENVLGYSGTNSRYVKITKSDFYNNGVGVVPNTLDSEPYEPTADGKITKNNIFWNNFNYFMSASRVETVSGGLGQIGDQTINFPTGVGIVLLGADGWKVTKNKIFGNFKWGAAAISDPFNEGDDAVSRNNQFVDNQMGRNGTDTNAVDFFVDGSGGGNCFSGNVSSTFDADSPAAAAALYPGCPQPAGGGTGTGDPAQFGKLASYVLSDPPETQQCSWTEHAHPKFKKFKPLEVPGVIPECP